jgi:hypothetical protein
MGPGVNSTDVTAATTSRWTGQLLSTPVPYGSPPAPRPAAQEDLYLPVTVAGTLHAAVGAEHLRARQCHNVMSAATRMFVTGVTYQAT